MDNWYVSEDHLVDALRSGISQECELESTAEDCYAVIGPLDLRYLAGFLMGWFSD